MNHNFNRPGSWILLLALLSICCKTGDPVDETYIPIITNQWTDVANNRHQFNFNAPQSNVAMGSFTGTEELLDSALTFNLNGTFSNRNISFIVSRRGRDTTYSGRFTADTLIDCGALKLFRRR